MSSPTTPATRSRAPDPADAPPREESLAAHARRALGARIAAVLDRGIATLQALRVRVAGAPTVADDEDDRRMRSDRPRDRRGAADPEPAAEPPKPKRRLRAVLVFAGILLVGAIGGGALAYTQFQKQLGTQLAAKQRLQAALDKKTRPSGEIGKAFEQEQARRAAAEQKLAAALADYAESTGHSDALLGTLLAEQRNESERLQAALAEATRTGNTARQTLADEQARRTAAEAALETTRAEHARSAREQERALAATERQLAKAERQLGRLSPDEEPESPRESPRRSSERSPRPVKTGNCTLASGDVNALRGCIDNFNE